MEEETIPPDHFKCALCGGIFEKGWTDDDATREEIEQFSRASDDPAELCDDCYKKFMITIFN